MKRLLFIFPLIFSCQLLTSQAFYYVRKSPPPGPSVFYLGIFDVETCQSSDILQIDPTGFNNPFNITDIAVSPSGEFYFTVNSAATRYITKLNTPSNTLSIITVLPSSCNSLTCDSDGVLWAGGGGTGLLSYDLATGMSTSYGLLNYFSSGDFTFRDNQLFGISVSNEIMQINIDAPSQSTVAFAVTLPPHMSAWGVISSVESCDSTLTYLTVTNHNDIIAPLNTINQLYLVDFSTQTANYLCDTPGPILGAASAAEFLASDCSVRLDLDADNSSGTPDSTDFQPLALCGDMTTLAVTDTDAVFYSGYRVDSLRARLLLPAPDAPQEYLSAQASGSVSVGGQGTAWITFTAINNTAVAVANNDYQTVLRSILWHNDAVPFTPGPRTVEVIAYASGGRTDTAYAFLSVPEPVFAGRDTALVICADAPSFDLLSLIAPNATVGGIWSPETLAGNSIFSPQTDTSGAYQYFVSNGICPADTAIVAISVMPLPVFSLGDDAAICMGESLTLETPGVAVWQDGTNADTYTAIQSGLYWAEFTDNTGCIWRDSINLTLLQPAMSELSTTACFGSTYVWNNQMFTADTALCVTFNAANGCDSLDCLSLMFYHSTLALDTTICSGQTLSWLGQTFSQPGLYLDTFLYNGCQHTVTLQLAVQPFQQSFFEVEICPGDSLNFNGKMLFVPGVYIDTLQSLIVGCDSVVTLTLNLLTAPEPNIAGNVAVCADATTTLTVTGVYNNYEWSDGATAPFLEAVSGVYSVTVTDANGCKGADTVLVNQWPPMDADWDYGSPLCHGGTDGFIELTDLSGGVQPFVFQLNGSTSSNNAIFPNLSAGSWTVEVTDSVGCSFTEMFELIDPPNITLDLGPSPLLTEGESYLIPLQINTVGPFNYTWSPPQGLSCTDCPEPIAMPTENTTYSLLLSDQNGCSTLDSLTIRVVEQAPEIYAPNIFSPNDDGRNDVFTLFGNASEFVNIELLQVYDRWGNLVFEGLDFPLNDETRGWDGSFRGKNMQPGVFVFYSEIRTITGNLVKKGGEVTVVRY